MPDGMPNQTRRPVRLAEKIDKNLKIAETSPAADKFQAIVKELAGIPWNHNETRRLIVLAMIAMAEIVDDLTKGVERTKEGSSDAQVP